ncbi:MAG: PAS domain-containing protein [Roseovarius sp.]|nr:PAS domain-containing protein [Roseovarius sp.]
MWDDQRDIEAGKAGTRGAVTDVQTAAHLRAFRAHWEACRRGGDVPMRADIDPRGIEPLISSAFIAERIAPGVVRLRVAGMALNDLMGMEVRGMPLTTFIAPSDRDAFALRLVDLFDGPAILRMSLTSRRGLGRPALGGTLMMLPLRSDLGDISRALGCLVTDGPVGRTPRRFAIVQAETLPLSDDGMERPAAPLRAINGTGARSAPRLRDRSHLRLVI